jgi:predicted RNase H-like HicB family nuclease
MTKEFHVIIEKDKNGYFARCLDLEGCFAQGQTHEETETNMVDAIKLHLEDMGNEEELSEPESVSLSSVKVVVSA